MSCALNSAEAKVQSALTIMTMDPHAPASVVLVMRYLRGAIVDLNKLRAESPQRRVLDQQIEIGYESAQPGAPR